MRSPAMKRCLFLLILVGAYTAINCLNIDGCNNALGMETGEISDHDLSASSSFDESSVGPQNGRVRNEKSGGAWCPKNQIKPGVQEWFQIDLRLLTTVTAVETQGRYGGGVGVEFPSGYMLEYWRPGMDKWRRYKNRTSKELISGNNNTFTPVLYELDWAIVATKVRFVPWSDYTRTICMRVELYGCPYADRLLAYSTPQGFRGGDVDLRDKTYDGQVNSETSETTNGGLGQLFDGRTGEDDFKTANFEWVGWRKNDLDGPVEIALEFKDLRNFTSMSFRCNNRYLNDVQVFSKARLFFGLSKNALSNTPMEYVYHDDKMFDYARWVKVAIPYQVAQYVRVELEFASKFMLISEIQFDSTPVKGNASFIPFENKLAEDSTTLKNIVPVAFDEFARTTKFKTEKMSVFTLNEMPAEYVGLIVGISLAVAGICAVVALIIVIRHRKNATSTVYSSAAYDGYPMAGNLHDVKMYLSRDGRTAVVTQCRDNRPAPSASVSGSSYVVNFGRMENDLSEKLPRSNGGGPQPPKLPHPVSPPPEYRSSNSQTAEDSSEYADPDSPVKSSSNMPLLPPPPPVHKRRGSFKLNFDCKKSSRSTTATEDDSLHYASSVVASPESSDVDPCSSISFDSPCFNNEATEIVTQIPRHLLHLQEKLGQGEFGDVHLCMLQQSIPGSSSSAGRLVAVKSLRKSANENSKSEFQKETHILSKLKDDHIVQLLGVCTQDEPWLMVVEYMEHGDLNQYLQQNADTLTYQNLVYVASQVAGGMKYLESLNLVHRDLATRNCLVGEDLKIKIADFGMARSLYSSDYYRVEGRFVLPIRWMAWECILLGKFTPKTDVWAFGVTLWEIFTLAKVQPYFELNDTQVIDNIQNMYHNGMLLIYLPQPAEIPSEIYDLMLECWNRDESKRPTFHEIHLFLQNKIF